MHNKTCIIPNWRWIHEAYISFIFDYLNKTFSINILSVYNISYPTHWYGQCAEYHMPIGNKNCIMHYLNISITMFACWSIKISSTLPCNCHCSLPNCIQIYTFSTIRSDINICMCLAHVGLYIKKQWLLRSNVEDINVRKYIPVE
jgi:hypothetical protein